MKSYKGCAIRINIEYRLEKILIKEPFHFGSGSPTLILSIAKF